MGNGRSVVEDGAAGDEPYGRISAPPEVVFRAWTDAKQLAEWWGPKGFTNPVCEVDTRLGGAIHIHMRAPDGMVYPMTGRFMEIDRPHRLVFTTAAIDSEGRPMFEVLNTVIFTSCRWGNGDIAGCAGDKYDSGGAAVPCGHVAGLEPESGPACGACCSALKACAGGLSFELGRQRSFEVAVDVEDGVGVGQFEDVEYFGAGGDEAELAAADLHIAVEDHEDAEAGAVEEFDAGEVEDELSMPLSATSLIFDSTSRRRMPRVMRPDNRKTAVVGSTRSSSASRIMGQVSPVCLQAYRRFVLGSCDASLPRASWVSSIAGQCAKDCVEPLMVRVVENEGRALRRRWEN